MSIVEETKQALLALFPEQQAAESAERQETATETADAGEATGQADAVAPGRGVVVTDYPSSGVHLQVMVEPGQVVESASILKDQGFFLEAITGVDWPKEEQMEIIYDYNRVDKQLCRVMVSVRIPRNSPEIPTISEIHPGADWHERETHDFFGIKFMGHPYLVPLLLPEDADFHPLLKDFKP